jgi:WhiB family transcriptional regulator, redox-sensing transcriptional regulator
MSSVLTRDVSKQPAREDWRSLAECRSAEPDLFFPESSSGASITQIAEAKAFCGRCRVRRQCLAFAARTHQAYGVWGGMTEGERCSARLVARRNLARQATIASINAPIRLEAGHEGRS